MALADLSITRAPGSGPEGLPDASCINPLDSAPKKPEVLKAVEAGGFDSYKIDYSPVQAPLLQFRSAFNLKDFCVEPAR